MLKILRSVSRPNIFFKINRSVFMLNGLSCLTALVLKKILRN